MTLPAKEIQLRGNTILQLPFLPPASLYGAKLGDLNDVDITDDTDGNVLTIQPDGSFALEELPAGLGAPEWGDLTGTLADQSDLASALGGKAASSHTHATSEVTGLDAALAGKAASSHTHTTSEVTGLDAALAGKAASSHTHATSEVTGLDAALAGKAPLASPTFTGTPAVPTATGGTNTTQAASTAFVMSAVSAAVAGLLEFQSDQDCSGNPNYPAAAKGDVYYVSVAGKIGGASGKSVDVGDAIVCKADNAGGTDASVGTSWFILEKNLAGALLSANNLSDIGDAATARGNLGLTIGTHVQAFDADLTAIAGLTSAADKGIQFTGSGTAGTFDLTAAAKTLLDDATVDLMIATLGGAAATGTGGLMRRTNPTVTGSLTLADADLAANRYAASSTFRFRRVNGSSGSETQVVSGNAVALFGSIGWHSGANFHSTFGAYFSMNATENYTATAQGTDFRIFTTPNASATPVERVRIGHTGYVGIGVSAEPTAHLDVVGDTFRLRNSKTPASAGSAGNAGDICWDATHFYVCIATNTWRRFAHATF